MRVVFDTNVLISAALKAISTPATALQLAERRCQLLKSVATERELVEVLSRSRLSRLIPPRTSTRLLALIAAGESVVISERVALCRDPADDMFLELAVNGRADFLVSGDADLLSMKAIREIPIINAAAFVALVTH